MLGIRDLLNTRNRKSLQGGTGWRRLSCVLLAAVTAMSPVSVSAASGASLTGCPALAETAVAAPTPSAGSAPTVSAGSATSAAPSATTENNREIQVHLAGVPGDPVPFNVMDRDTASLLKLISEGLVVLDENNEPAPGCAESWEVSEDGRQWIFRLRKNLCWSDGSPMEADDFVSRCRRIADPSTEALYGQDLSQNIAGYEEVLNGDTEALKIRAKDKRTLVVDLSSPDPDFARTCTAWSLLPIREQLRDDENTDAADWSSVTGNGPYYIDSIVPGQEYVLKTNPYYHRAAGDAFDTVCWTVSGDVNEEYSDFLNGGIDAISAVPGEEEKQLDADGLLQKKSIPDTMGICFNCRNEALSDARVRRALSLVCDRTFIASTILQDVYLPEVPEGGDGEEKQGDMQNHLSEAKKLLKDAGYKNGKGFPVLTCIADENGGACLTAEYLASAWKDLGIEVRVESADAEDAAQEKAAGTFDIFCGSIFLSSDLFPAELVCFTTDDENNISGFSSEEFDSLIEEASQTSDDEEYADTLGKAFAILQDELPVAPLATRCVSWLCREEYPGIRCDSTGCWQLWDIEDSDQTADNKARSDGTAAADSAGSGTGRSGTTDAPESGTDVFVTADIAEKGDQSEGDNDPAALPQVGTARATDFEDLESLALLECFGPSDYYFERTNQTAYLTGQAWILGRTGEEVFQLDSLPKYSEVHLTGIGNGRYARITQDGEFRYILADKVTTDAARIEDEHAKEETDLEQKEKVTGYLHYVKESELAGRAADVRVQTEEILAEIERREMLRKQTRNPNWNGPVLSRSRGSVIGPSGKETYYNLNMNGVVNIMRRMGNTDEYWVRDDGCKMLGDYIMCAANLRVHPRGSLVECSLGTCIVCDTGGFASRNAHQLDIAVTW